MPDFKVYPAYDKLAYSYDERYETEACKEENRDIQALLNRYVGDHNRVLDVGCGTGFGLRILNDKNVQYTGVDTARRMITIAYARYPDATFILGDADDFEGTYDTIISLFSIPYMGLDGLKKYLAKGRQGGRFVAVYYDTPYLNPASLYVGHEARFEQERRPQVEQIISYLRSELEVLEEGPIGNLGAYRYIVCDL